MSSEQDPLSPESVVPEGDATEDATVTPEPPLKGSDHVFPLDSYKAAAIHMRRPFTPAAVKFKVQSNLGEKGALVVSYIDARLVVERLNLIVPHLWADDYEKVDERTLRCHLTVDGITRRDVGQGAGKGAYSDALKRAAVKFGVGVSLYAIPQVHLWLSGDKGWLSSRKNKKGETIFEITDKGDTALRRGYEKWLGDVGVQRFGDPLDHGDTERSVGDPEAEPETPAGDDEPILELLETDEAEERRGWARGMYAEIKNLQGVEKYPPGAFNQQLRAHGHSLDALDNFLDLLAALRDEAREHAQEEAAA